MPAAQSARASPPPNPTTMCTRALTALLALLWACAVRAVPLYQRPINGDCIEMDGSSDGVQLYPDQYRLVGDEQVTDDFTTQASPMAGRANSALPPLLRQVGAAMAHALPLACEPALVIHACPHHIDC